MKRNSDYGYTAGQASKLELKLQNTTYLIFILHTVMILTALVNFGICMWIRFDLDFRVWVKQLDWYTYWYCMYFIMVCMLYTMVNSVVGYIGTWKQSRGYLNFNVINFSILIVLEIVAATLIIVYGCEESEALVLELKEKLLAMVYAWDDDMSKQRILKQIMEYVGCCGADGGDDFYNALKPIPWECRDQITGTEYAYGCMQQLAWWLEPWTSVLAALTFFLVACNIAGIVAKQSLKKCLRQYEMLYEGETYGT